MRTIRIAFSNFWGRDDSFSAEYLYRMFPFLRDHYDIILGGNNPSYVFYSVYGFVKNQFPGAVRILISGEAGDHFAEGGKMGPGEFETCFYHFGLTCAFNNTHPNHIFLPQPYIMLNLYNNGWKSLIRDGWETVVPGKPYFCNFIYGNPHSMDRRHFMKLLARYRNVECAGPVDNNTNVLRGQPAYDRAGYLAKQQFQSLCRFSIAFENNYFPGYTTEKLTDPLVARSVPIYSGNPKVDQLFNPGSFIDVDDFDTYEDAVEYIVEVNETPSLYEAYLNAPPFVDNCIPDKYSDTTYLNFFRRIFGE